MFEAFLPFIANCSFKMCLAMTKHSAVALKID